MINQEYSIAISETLEILNHTKKDDINKIPRSFLDFLRSNASRTYISSLDYSKPLEQMNLNPKTIGILSIINKKYWCKNDEERKSFEEKLQQNEKKYQEELIAKYNPDGVFKKRNEEEITTSSEEVSLVEYKKDTLFDKIKQFIRKIFMKK